MIPILVGNCKWQSISLLEERQMLPGGPTPLIEYVNDIAKYDRVRYELIQAIESIVKKLQGKEEHPPPPPPKTRKPRKKLLATLGITLLLTMVVLFAIAYVVYHINFSKRASHLRELGSSNKVPVVEDKLKDIYNIGLILGIFAAYTWEILPNVDTPVSASDFAALQRLLNHIRYPQTDVFIKSLQEGQNFFYQQRYHIRGTNVPSELFLKIDEPLRNFIFSVYGKQGVAHYILGACIPGILWTAWYFESAERLRHFGKLPPREESILQIYREKTPSVPSQQTLRVIAESMCSDSISLWVLNIADADVTNATGRQIIYSNIRKVSTAFGVDLPTESQWPLPNISHRK